MNYKKKKNQIQNVLESCLVERTEKKSNHLVLELEEFGPIKII